MKEGLEFTLLALATIIVGALGLLLFDLIFIRSGQGWDDFVEFLLFLPIWFLIMMGGLALDQIFSRKEED